MYEQFFGLQKPPFRLTPDPEFLYLTPQHREALAGLTYAIMGRKGFVVLVANAGTGKTTLLTRMMQYLPLGRVQSSVIVIPTLTPAEFLEATMLDFGFKDIPASKAQRIAALQSFLWKGHRSGKVSALIIDEAHKLSAELLEEIRLLGNMESGDVKLLQVALVGQSELDDVLNSESMRQFKQRIALRLEIQPLSESETEQYIGYRWMKAGGKAAPFTAEAVAGIKQGARGIPRVINTICDNALMLAYGEGSGRVEARHVLSACHELRLAAAEPVRVAVAEAPAPVMRTAAPTSRLTRLASKLGLVQRVETA